MTPSLSIFGMRRWRARSSPGGMSGKRSRRREASSRCARTSRNRGSGRDCIGPLEGGSIAGGQQTGLGVIIRGPTRRPSFWISMAATMLTKEILFGMNILTLAGFAVMGITLTLNRMGQVGKALSIGLMAAGTALVFFGLYAAGWSW